ERSCGRDPPARGADASRSREVAATARISSEYSRAVSTAEIAAYWSDARTHHPRLPIEVPEAWAFGATPEHADELLRLALADITSGPASSLGDYEAEDEPLPAVGDLSIILDGAGRPRAVLEVTSVRIVPFDQVTEEHARAEGEGDRTLGTWGASMNGSGASTPLAGSPRACRVVSKR